MKSSATILILRNRHTGRNLVNGLMIDDAAGSALAASMVLDVGKSGLRWHIWTDSTANLRLTDRR